MKNMSLFLIALNNSTHSFAETLVPISAQEAQVAQNNALIDELNALQTRLSDAKSARMVRTTSLVSGAAMAALGISFGALKAPAKGGDLTGPLSGLINLGAKGTAIIGGAGVLGGGYLLKLNADQISSLESAIEEKTAQLKAVTQTLKNN